MFEIGFHRPVVGASGSVTAEAERDLVRAAQRGDHVAFALLVRRCQNLVFAMAYALTGRSSLSEDVTQETFVLAWSRINLLREPERFRGWLLTIARRASLRALRDQRTEHETALSHTYELASLEPSPLDRAVSREQEQFLWRALQRIPERYRVPLVLFYQDCHSVHEVALALDMTDENAKQRLSRGRRILERQVIEMLESVLKRAHLGKPFAAATVSAALLAAAKPASAGLPRHEGRRPFVGAGLKAVGLTMTVLLTLASALHVARSAQSHVDTSERRRLADTMPLPSVPVPVFQGVGLDHTAAENRERGSHAPSITGGDVRGSMLHFDFEDGLLPEVFSLGHLAPGPPRAGNRYAAMGTLMPGGDWEDSPTTGVAVRTPNLTYRETLVVEFDYWMAAGYLQVATWNRDRNSNYYLDFPDAVRAQWSHACARLSIFAPALQPRGAMEPGDDLANIQIFGGVIGGKAFFVDNVTIVDDARAAGSTAACNGQ